MYILYLLQKNVVIVHNSDCVIHQTFYFCKSRAKLPFLGRLWMTSTAAWKRLWQSSISVIVRDGISDGVYFSHTPAAECSLTGQPVNYIHRWQMCHSVIQKSSLGRNCSLRLLVRLHLFNHYNFYPSSRKHRFYVLFDLRSLANGSSRVNEFQLTCLVTLLLLPLHPNLAYNCNKTI